MSRGKPDWRMRSPGYASLPQTSSEQPAKGFVPFMTVTDLNGRVILTERRPSDVPEPEWRAGFYERHAAADRYVFVQRQARRE